MTETDTTPLAGAADPVPRKRAPQPLRTEADYLTQRDYADYTRRSVRTAERERAQGLGPPYIVIGSRILYRRADVDAWLAAHVRGGRATAGALSAGIESSPSRRGRARKQRALHETAS
jgi:hypothetical protein